MAKERQAYWAYIKLGTPVKLIAVILCAPWHSCADLVNTARGYDWNHRCENTELQPGELQKLSKFFGVIVFH